MASSLIGGVVAANVSLGGIPMKLKVAELQGNGLGMFRNAATASNGNKQVATAWIGDATIKGVRAVRRVAAGGHHRDRRRPPGRRLLTAASRRGHAWITGR